MDIVYPCVTWVPILWDQLRRLFLRNCLVNARADHQINHTFVCETKTPLPTITKAHPYIHDSLIPENGLVLLPDDIIMKIISRLDPECTFKCSRVCKSLSTLLSCPSFVAIQLSQASPTLVIHCYDVLSRVDEAGVYACDIVLHRIRGRNAVAFRMKLRLSNICYKVEFKPYLFGSYNGLLLFKNKSFHDSILYVWNPITHEQVTVISPNLKYDICGLYFHTETGEYRVLYVRKAYVFWPRFFVLNLRHKLWREISNCSQVPYTHRPPVILNGALHWIAERDNSDLQHFLNCSKSVLIFKIDTEEFFTIPHPAREKCLVDEHNYMQLFEMEGHLGICDPISSTELCLWIWEENRVWVKMHTINVDLLVGSFVCNESLCPRSHKPPYQVLHINKDELLLGWCSWDVYCYHLKQKSFRMMGKDHFKGKILNYMAVHFDSIASLHSDKIIFLEERVM